MAIRVFPPSSTWIRARLSVTDPSFLGQLHTIAGAKRLSPSFFYRETRVACDVYRVGSALIAGEVADVTIRLAYGAELDWRLDVGARFQLTLADRPLADGVVTEAETPQVPDELKFF